MMMAVIFYFSATPITKSSEESHFVGKTVGRVFIKDFEKQSAKKQEAFIIKVDLPVRKTAHMTEYAILSVFLMLFFLPENKVKAVTSNEYDIKMDNENNENPMASNKRDVKMDNENNENPMASNKRDVKMEKFRAAHPVLSSALFSEIIAFLYACTDEFHQLFTNGRGSHFTDVLIDSCGAFIAILLVSLLVRRKY